ncbi:MAG: universal stress protein, partial [Rhodospirillales bacterium]|nr:universal stress protein [Rhodospirillales bacterium]
MSARPILNVKRILLASHDTAGARAAEAAAFDLCVKGGHIVHLIVVPDFWKGMRGDDWLNNAVTQDRFGKYVEDQLEREMVEHVGRVSEEAARREIDYRAVAKQGKPAACLLEAADEVDCDLIVIGSPRPKGMEGYRSRM